MARIIVCGDAEVLVKPAPPADTRKDFPLVTEIQTRWDDNDVYGHVNNVVYYAYFDTVINRYLIEHGLEIEGATIGVCVESACRYLHEIAFPERIEAGLRVTDIGKSSVGYEIGIFASGDDRSSSDGRQISAARQRRCSSGTDASTGTHATRSSFLRTADVSQRKSKRAISSEATKQDSIGLTRSSIGIVFSSMPSCGKS